MVSWALGSLGAGANIQRHVTFQVSAAGGNPLGPIEASFTDSSGHVARASDNRVVIQAPAIQYTLTTQYDPATPDQTIEFDVTVHNLTTSSQPVALGWTVPQYTTFGSSGCSAAGCPKTTDFGTLTAGQSMTQQLRLRVADIAAVADGANIILELFDLSRAASISRSVVVRDSPALALALSTDQGTVAPGGNFTYTLAAANISGGSSHGATLTAVVPQGATFVSADGTGVLDGGVVSWALGSLGAGANIQRHVTFQVNAAGSATSPWANRSLVH